MVNLFGNIMLLADGVNLKSKHFKNMVSVIYTMTHSYCRSYNIYAYYNAWYLKFITIYLDNGNCNVTLYCSIKIVIVTIRPVNGYTSHINIITFQMYEIKTLQLFAFKCCNRFKIFLFPLLFINLCCYFLLVGIPLQADA